MTTLAPCCTACHRPLPAWDPDRHACPGCQQRAAGQLAELPGLHAALDPSPGRGAPLVGARHSAAGSRPPVDLGVIDLREQVPAVLDSWVRDWADVGGHDLPGATVAEMCTWLRWHLDWACRRHPAAAEALREIRDAWAATRAAATGERGERRVTVQCGCGGLLCIAASTPGATCPGCATRYGHDDVLRLPLAPRAAAAAAA